MSTMRQLPSVDTFQVNSLVTVEYDTITASYPSGTVEVYTYSKLGATVAVVTVTYTDSTKATLSSVVRS